MVSAASASLLQPSHPFIGHSHIDILNVDLEGWEFPTLRAMIGFANGTRSPLPFGQLLMELHAWNQRFDEFLEWFEQLEFAGLRPFMAEVGLLHHLHRRSSDVPWQPNLIYQNYNRQSGPELVDVCPVLLLSIYQYTNYHLVFVLEHPWREYLHHRAQTPVPLPRGVCQRPVEAHAVRFERRIMSAQRLFLLSTALY